MIRQPPRDFPLAPRSATTWVILGLAAVLAAHGANAEVSILPRLQEVEATRAQRKVLDFRLANRFDAPLSMRMVAAPLGITEDGLPFAAPDTSDRGCQDWLRFEPGEFTVPPGETRTVRARMIVPDDAAGTYGAFITATYVLSEEEVSFELDTPQKTTIDLNMAVTSILMTTVRARGNRAVLEPEPFVIENGGAADEEAGYPLMATQQTPSTGSWEISLPVKNTGNTMTVIGGRVKIYRPGPRLVDSADLEVGRGYLLPGRRRIMTAAGQRLLDDGEYVASLTIHQRQGRPTQGHFPFFVIDGQAAMGEPSEDQQQVIAGLSPKLGLSRNWLDMRVTPGARRHGGVRVSNHSKQQLLVRPRVEGFLVTPEGHLKLGRDLGEARSCRDWIRVNPDTVVLAAGRSRNVRVTVAAPDSLEGEYYAAVGFVEEGADWSAMSSDMRMRRTLIITAREERSAEVMAAIDTVETRSFGPINRIVETRIANGGNVHCYAAGRIEFYDEEWNQVLEPVTFGSERSVVMPGGSRHFEVPCPGALDPGRYKAVVLVDYHDDAETLVYEQWFTQATE
jgi:hypothetical protein